MNAKTLESAPANHIWPPPVPGLRSITKKELERLATALEKPVDRKHLKYWVSTSISNAVKLSSLPSPTQARERLKTFATEGRKWIEQVDSDPVKSLLGQKALQEGKSLFGDLAEHRTKIDQVKGTMTRICEQATPPPRISVASSGEEDKDPLRPR